MNFPPSGKPSGLAGTRPVPYPGSNRVGAAAGGGEGGGGVGRRVGGASGEDELLNEDNPMEARTCIAVGTAREPAPAIDCSLPRRRSALRRGRLCAAGLLLALRCLRSCPSLLYRSFTTSAMPRRSSGPDALRHPGPMCSPMFIRRIFQVSNSMPGFLGEESSASKLRTYVN